MKSRFALKDIAHQAGLSLATVDRVLHEREGVRVRTQARVKAAIEDLEGQFKTAGVTGRRLTLDVVVEAPRRFSSALRSAFEAELPGMRPSSLSARFHMSEVMPPDDLAKLLRAIAKRGTHGLVLKAQDTEETHTALAPLIARKCPIWTFVTDQPTPLRHHYVGMDNQAAGRAAGWLLGQILGPQPATVLITLSARTFAGEDARAEGLRSAFAAHFPHLKVRTVSDGYGVGRATHAGVSQALAQDPSICAVYSAGGANRAILQAFEDVHRTCRAFGAHDLDASNTQLLADKKLSFVIHHDLRQDARALAQLVLAHHQMLPKDFDIQPSRFSIATPLDHGL